MHDIVKNFSYMKNSTQILLEEYSGEYAKVICNKYFKNKQSVSSDDIIQITEIQQINLFVFQLIFENWKQQFEQVKSVYFNYEHHEVINEVNTLMSVVSKHISIARNYFEPLLSSAVSKTLHLLFLPKQYYIDLFSRLDKDIEIHTHTLELAKYIIIHTDYKETLIKELNKANQALISQETAIEICEKINFKGHFDDPESYIVHLNKTLELYPEKIFPQWKSDLNINLQKPSFIDELEQDMNMDIELDERQKNRAKLFQTAEQAIRKAKTRTQANEDTSALNNDYPLGISSDTQWESFKNELFQCKEDELVKALNIIEHADDYHSAIEIIKDKYINTYQWDLSSVTTTSFLEIINDYFD